MRLPHRRQLLIFCFAFFFCPPALLFASDFFSFGVKIGITDGWGYDQSSYIATYFIGPMAGAFVDFRIIKVLSVSLNEDYHAWTINGSYYWDRYDFLSTLLLANFSVPNLKWRPVISLGPRMDYLVNLAERNAGVSYNRDISNTNKYSQGLSIGLGIVSPRIKRFDFSLRLFFNSQLTQAGDIYPPGSPVGGAVLVPKSQTVDLFMSVSFYPLRDK